MWLVVSCRPSWWHHSIGSMVTFCRSLVFIELGPRPVLGVVVRSIASIAHTTSSVPKKTLSMWMAEDREPVGPYWSPRRTLKYLVSKREDDRSILAYIIKRSQFDTFIGTVRSHACSSENIRDRNHSMGLNTKSTGSDAIIGDSHWVYIFLAVGANLYSIYHSFDDQFYFVPAILSMVRVRCVWNLGCLCTLSLGNAQVHWCTDSLIGV